jgi:hypothetical protein
MKKFASRCYLSPYDSAVLHTGMGERDAALQCLQQASQERCPRVIWLNVEPAFDGLREDRRLQSLVRFGLLLVELARLPRNFRVDPEIS